MSQAPRLGVPFLSSTSWPQTLTSRCLFQVAFIAVLLFSVRLFQWPPLSFQLYCKNGSPLRKPVKLFLQQRWLPVVAMIAPAHVSLHMVVAHLKILNMSQPPYLWCLNSFLVLLEFESHHFQSWFWIHWGAVSFEYAFVVSGKGLTSMFCSLCLPWTWPGLALGLWVISFSAFYCVLCWF